MVFRNGVGGDGRSTLFENWDAVKLKKYDVDPDEYDHTNMASRPSILIDNYHTHKTPKYDPLDAGTGEAGLLQDEDGSINGSISGHTSGSSSIQRRSSKAKLKI